MIRSSDLDTVAECEADAAVGANRRMIQQLSPGLRVECRYLLWILHKMSMNCCVAVLVEIPDDNPIGNRGNPIDNR